MRSLGGSEHWTLSAAMARWSFPAHARNGTDIPLWDYPGLVRLSQACQVANDAVSIHSGDRPAKQVRAVNAG